MSVTRDIRALPPECPEGLTRCLRAYGRRRLVYRCLRAALSGAAAALFVLLVGLVFDRFADAAPYVRLVPLVAFALAVLWGVVGTGVAAASARVGAEALAGEVDRRSGGRGDVLRSAVNFLLRRSKGERPGHAFLVERSVREADESARAQDVARLQPAAVLWRRSGLVGVLVAAFVILAGHPGMCMELLLRRFLNPFGNYPRPSWTQIRVDAGASMRLEAGDDLVVRARLEGRVPEGAECVLVVSAARRGGEASEAAATRMAMQPMPDGALRGVMRNVRENFSFFLEAADARTARYDVEVLHPPAVVSMEAQYEPPRYARLPTFREQVLYREIRALAGTAVSITFATDCPVAKAAVTLELSRSVGTEAVAEGDRPDVGPGDEQANPHNDRLAKLIDQFGGSGEEKPKSITKSLPVSLSPDRMGGKFHLRLEQSGMLRLALTSDSGVTNRFAPGYKVTAIPDNPPVVSITNLPEQMSVRADDVLRVCYHARDDLGIADLQYRAAPFVNRYEPTVSEFVPLDKFGAKEAEGEVAIPVRELAPESIYVPTGGQEDAVLEFSLSAVDLKGQVAYSRRARITVLRDTYDRQLRELLQQMDDLSRAADRNITQVTSAINSLTVLRDSMGAAGAWSADHQKKLDETASRLKLALFTDWPANQRHAEYRYTLYPYRAQAAADVLFNLTVFQGADYSCLSELGKSEDGRRRLGDAAAALERLRDFLGDFKGALDATSRTFQFDLMLYLVELSRSELARFSEGEAEFTELLKERQAARATKIVGLMDALGLQERSDAFRDASDRLRQAASEYQLEGIRRALEDVRNGALALGEPPAGPNPALEELQRKYDDAWFVQQGEREARAGLAREPFGRLKAVWSEALLVAGDTQVTDDPLMAGRAVAFIRLLSGVQEGAALVEPISAMRGASQLYSVALHLNQAFQEGRTLIEGLDSGALEPRSDEATEAWARMRDALLVLMDREAAGGLSALGPDLKGGVAGLLAYRPLVIRWDPANIWNAPEDRARLRSLVAQTAELRAKAVVELGRGLPDVSPLLAEVCTRLAGLFDKELKDALDRIAALEEEAKRDLPPPKDEQEARARGSIANYRFGEAKEIVLTQYAAAHRKVSDLWEVRAILTGDVPRETVAQHAAVVSYLWWLISDVTLSFGRYHGPSVVRRHDETAQAYLERMKDYPENLSTAAAVMRHLAQTPGKPCEAVDAMVRISTGALDFKHDGEEVDDFVASLRTLRGEAGAEIPAAALARLGKDRAASAFITARAIIPLRRIASALRSGRPGREHAQGLLADVAAVRAVAVVMEDMPERDALMSQLDAIESAARAKEGAMEDGDRQEALGLCDRCVEALTPGLSLPEFLPKVSKRLDREATLNDRIFHCRQRTHRLWQLEVVRQRRHYEHERVAALLEGAGRADGWRGPALQFGHLRVAQRKSSGIQREAGGTLDIHIPGVRYDLLAMPKHLYDELVRGQNEPYPEQFKDPAVNYLRGLIEDAKR